MSRIVLGAVLLALSVAAQSTDERQVHWQRSLADARALVEATGRPLFLAVNMDGESASDRIVHENYLDPAFVAATRECVCLVASVFRHSLRDYDDEGRRIPCPRLGQVTCGEHVALETALFAELLADGERVAPRHAVVLPDGTKAWDESLLFDLGDLDRALFETARAERERRGGAPLVAAAPGPDWADLARRRDHAGRLALETELVRATEAAVAGGLEALAAAGDAGSLDALRVVAARLPHLPPWVRHRFLAAVRALGLEQETAGFLREMLQGPGALLGAAPDGREILLPLLAELDGTGPRSRSTLLGCFLLEEYGEERLAALRIAFGPETSARWIERQKVAPLSLRAFLRTAGEVALQGRPVEPSPADPLRDVDTLESALAELEWSVASGASSPALHAEYAQALLDLGRRRLEEQGTNAYVLFGDAERYFARALEQDPARADWWLERARTAYYLGDHEAQVAHAERALAAGSNGAEPRLLADAARINHRRVVAEALRWIGDGDARSLTRRSGTDPEDELQGIARGLRALLLVAASPLGDAQDWTSAASFCGALGLRREELSIAMEGARRFPAAPELHQVLRDALWTTGRMDLLPAAVEHVASRGIDPGAADWYAGYAWMLLGEDARRRESPDEAVAAYSRARERFEACAAREPDWGPSCAHYSGVCWLGQGLAHVRAGRRAACADALVEAVRTGADVTGMRDGLGYDVFDVVDKVFEWRATGASDVDPHRLLDRLDELAPDTAFWACALSDSQLREALRADGRNPERAMRESVDAAGMPILQWLGLPCAAGDAHLEAAIAIGRRALPRATTEEERKPLAQALTILAERRLEMDRLDDVRPSLAEAATILGLEAPPVDADEAALRATAEEMRELLGEARPRWRAGR